MEIDVQTRVGTAPPARRVRSLIARLARSVPAPNGGRRKASRERSVSILFCGGRQMRTLNRRWRGKDRSTDVLAFPGEGLVLGDIVVSVPDAARAARRQGEAVGREIDRLLLHGYLHLLGYDHETDRGEMSALERSLRRRFRMGDAA